MEKILHITSGDIAGDKLSESAVSGEVFVWHDILYDGPREPGWPDEGLLLDQARFLEKTIGGGLGREHLFGVLKAQYARLKTLNDYAGVVLWFDACLFDMSMLCHILACMWGRGLDEADLICVDAFPGIEPFHGLGQLSPEQLASMYSRRQPVTKDQFLFAERVDRAFANRDRHAFLELSGINDAPLPWIPAAVSRWLEEMPDSATGLGRLERMALDAVRSGCVAPSEIFSSVSVRETPPQYWGDITLWAKINALADRKPPLVRIEGPEARLPQWEGMGDLKLFRVYPADTNTGASAP